MRELLAKYRLAFVGIVLALLYWFTESFLDLFDASHKGATYIERLFAVGDSNELRMRAITIGLLIGFSVYAQILMNRRPKAEEGLRQSEERYRLVAQATNEAIWDIDIVTGKQMWSDAIHTIFGYPLEEVAE
ncbi:MAG TPA: PAS domain-containing protein, partial [Rubrobacteraceae bacterium]|nr:PAS domain-containing protein [Rubrobacteraceae bacterium]